jgi:hypothetical protein
VKVLVVLRLAGSPDQRISLESRAAPCLAVLQQQSALWSVAAPVYNAPDNGFSVELTACAGQEASLS